MVNAAEAGEKQERSEIARGGVVNFLAAFFGIDGNGFEPIGETFAQVFLKESLALDSVGVAAQHQRAIFEEGRNVVGDGVVVG